jgi:hypothetical protein
MNILFIKVPNKLEFNQRVNLKESILEALKLNGLDQTLTPIILENGIDASIYDKTLIQKLADNSDAIKEHTEAMNNLAAVLIGALGVDDEDPGIDQSAEQTPKYL